MWRKTLAGVFLALVSASVCAAGVEAGNGAAYTMRGVLRGVDPATGQATVTHEEVRGYMPAMTMNFDVADADELRGLRLGDTFTCRLQVTDSRAWIEQVHKENVPTISPFGPAIPVSRAAELNVGDPLPDIEMTNQRGQTMRLHDLGGEPLAISFVYLRCALPTYCPLLSRKFQAASTLLDRLELRGHAHFLSLSMDPEHDTPKSLAAYAAALEADPSVWIFATTGKAEMRRVGDAVGLEFQRQDGVINHNLRTVVIDGQGRIRRIFRGNTWTPQELVSELRAAIPAPR